MAGMLGARSRGAQIQAGVNRRQGFVNGLRAVGRESITPEQTRVREHFEVIGSAL
ncbi:hypothetical protein [Streptomyces sp. NPDC051684]|uniref:hypothetical protein n=1 Tax=Streptomyces sp. NPDC051684 TaxID=3365670 RepID=UPI00379AA2C3